MEQRRRCYTSRAISSYSELQQSLRALSESTETTTVTGAHGLLKQLDDMRMIICLHIVDEILSITGPSSRIFQATSTDLAVVVSTVSLCKSTLHAKRSDRNDFNEVLERAKRFGASHGIDETSGHRRKIRRRYADGTSDTPVSLGNNNTDDDEVHHMNDIYLNIYLPAIDLVLSDLSARFDDSVMPVIRQMMPFSAGNLLNKKPVTSSEVEIFCNTFNFDVDVVVRELNSFMSVFCANHSLVKMDDVLAMRNARSQTYADNSQDDSESASNMWIRHTFLQPYRLLYQLSSYPTLLTVYKQLVTVAVTSASAERAMSKVKLVKTRLRSTMADEYFSSLMLLASEKDLADNLVSDDIINQFAAMSPVLRKYLICS